jgi:hypothetical protein
MIARLAWRLRGLAIDAHPFDGDSMRFLKFPSASVYLTLMH